MDLLSILKVIFILALLLGAMYLMLFMAKKYFFSIDKGKAKHVKIEVLNSHMIAPKKFISVVQVSDKILVLGVADQSINLLYELENFTPCVENVEKSRAALGKNFLEQLKKNLGKQ